MGQAAVGVDGDLADVLADELVDLGRLGNVLDAASRSAPFVRALHCRAIDAKRIRCEHRPDADIPTTWFEVKLEDCPRFCGFNELGITPIRLGQKPDKPYMEELEVLVMNHS